MTHEQPSGRAALIAGIAVALAGMVCLVGGVMLLAWRVLEPEEAVILPLGAAGTPQDTPTPGVLSLTLAPPPLPANAAEIVILPVSELPTPTPADYTLRPTAIPSPTLTRTRGPTATLTPTPTQTPTETPTPVTPSITPAAKQPAPASVTAPAPSPTPSVTPSSTATGTATPVPPATLPAIPERIVIEKIGLNVPIVPVGQHPIRIAGQTYSQWNVPDERVAGWHENSAPLGVRGNTVLNGHHNVNGAVFHYLAVLEPGDMITLESGGEQHLYVIAQMMVLAEEGQPLATRRANARWILPTTDERVTLITCWPLEASTHRLVVIALSTGALDQLTGIP